MAVSKSNARVVFTPVANKGLPGPAVERLAPLVSDVVVAGVTNGLQNSIGPVPAPLVNLDAKETMPVVWIA